MIHLQSVAFAAPTPAQKAQFPFTVPALAALAATDLCFATAVTFFVGENGSGKSTVLEALALAIGSITVGSEQAEHDATLHHIRPFAKSLRLSWTRKTRRGFFMRSEDFFGYARRMHALRADLEAERQELDNSSLSPTGKALAQMPYNREIAGLQRRYGAGLDTVSHGESFLALFRARLVPDGLYLLDEPEAPLSPMRQLALIALIKQAVVEQGAQFIIATHSPIVMAIPEATIYSFDGPTVEAVPYEATEHVRLTRDFLNNPGRFLQHL
jgi:predicted ATPase